MKLSPLTKYLSSALFAVQLVMPAALANETIYSSDSTVTKLISETPSLGAATKSPMTPANTVSVAIGSASPQQPKTFLQYFLGVPCEGWNTAAISFTGQMQSPANQPALDGASIDSALLKEYCCQLKAQRILQRGQRKIIMAAYQFATSSGAFGTYCAVHRGSTSYLTQGDASSEDQDSISFCKDQYFVCLYSTDSDDDEAKGIISQIAKQLIEFIKPINKENSPTYSVSNKLPEIFNYMPKIERVPGSEKLIMGPIALRRFFIAPYSTLLGTLTVGAVADYKLEYPNRDRLKLLMAHYSSAEQAKLVFANYISTLASTNKEKEIEGCAYPTSLFKVSDNFLLCQIRDKQIIVINGARHKDSLGDLVHRIYF